MVATNTKQKHRNRILTKIIIIISAILLASFAVFVSVFDVYSVKGTSMEPTIMDGEYVIVKPNAKPNDNDIVVCDTATVYLKDKYIIKRYDAEKSTVGLYVVGDNTSDSLDSRDFGQLPKKDCNGVVVAIFSWQRGIIFV
ncbi:MAG: S26 family signal peptidase [Eubacteriales bacterium]|nr:S26 family signal peptidase [Eubacteriales bacterium]